MSEQPAYVRFRRDAPVVIGDVEPASLNDPTHMRSFGDEVISAVSRHKGLALLLNFEKVSYLSSAALTEIIRIREAVRANGGALRLCGLSPEIYKVFEITKLDGDFGVRANEATAHSIARFKRDIAAAPCPAPRSAEPSVNAPHG